jgi:large subunit ribosomal protein L18
MIKTQAKNVALARRQRRVRAKVRGTAARPRLRVTRTNAHIYAQLIDDVSAVTLASASSNEQELAKKIKGSASNKDAAKAVGELLAKHAAKAGIAEVVFDRGGHLYHGRVKALADSARQSGLKF